MSGLDQSAAVDTGAELLAVSLLPAAQLLVEGRVRVRGVWPRGADVDVTDEAGTWRATERRGAWRCRCGEVDGCQHVLAAALVVPERDR